MPLFLVCAGSLEKAFLHLSISPTRWLHHPAALCGGVSLVFCFLNDHSMLLCSLLSGSLELKISIKTVSLEKTCFLLENVANPLPLPGPSV